MENISSLSLKDNELLYYLDMVELFNAQIKANIKNYLSLIDNFLKLQQLEDFPDLSYYETNPSIYIGIIYIKRSAFSKIT